MRTHHALWCDDNHMRMALLWASGRTPFRERERGTEKQSTIYRTNIQHQHFDIQSTLDFLSFWILRTCGTANDVVQHCCRTAYLLSRKGNARRRLKFQFILVAHETPSVERQKFRGPDVYTFRYKRWGGTHAQCTSYFYSRSRTLPSRFKVLYMPSPCGWPLPRESRARQHLPCPLS